MDKRAKQGLKLVKDKAEEVAADARRTAELVDKAIRKAGKDGVTGGSGVLDKFKNDLFSLFRMLKSAAQGDYKGISKKSLVMAVGAILYFVNPFDLVPDFIIGTGLLDDATVLAFTLQYLRSDLSKFRQWEGTEEDPTPDAAAEEADEPLG